MSLDLRFARVIAAPPERVFAAFTSTEGQQELYGTDTDGWVVDSECDLRVGGLWSIGFGPSRAELYHHQHEFTAIEPPHRLLMTTTETRLDGSTFETTTEFRFEPHPGGTRMTMVQTGFPTAGLRDEHTIGLPHAFDRLERILDHGQQYRSRTSLDWRTLMTPARLIPLPDGPYEVTGPVEVADSGGRPIQPPAEKVYLCRCGRSASKPFCDGSHARTGWTEQA